MYSFIFYGIYRTLNYTVLSKGKEKQEDRRVSAVTLTSVVMGFHILTLVGTLTHRFGVIIPFFDKSNFKTINLIIVLLLFIYNYFVHIRNLRILSEKYKPLYDKYKGLDKMIGFGIPIVTFIIFMIFGTP